MKTGVNVHDRASCLSSGRIGIVTLILAIGLWANVTTCVASQTLVDSADESKTEKNFEKAARKFSPPWYSIKEDAVVFLPKEKERANDTKPKKRNEEGNALKAKDSVGFHEVLRVWLPVACLVVLLAVLVWFGVRALRERAAQRRFREGELLRRKRRIETLAVEARDRYDDLDAAAEEALALGDLRSALIFFFSWILVEMDKHDVVLLDKGKTNLEYWRELEGRPRLRDLYREIMGKFERVYFGGFLISRPEFDKVWRLRESFSEMMLEEDERKRRLEKEREEAFRRAAERNWRGPKTMLVLLASLIFFSSVFGCSKPVWRDAYSRAGTSIPMPNSLNGYDVFYRYCQLQNRGRVRLLRLYNDDFDSCDTIVWFCSGYGFETEGVWNLTSPHKQDYLARSRVSSDFDKEVRGTDDEELDDRSLLNSERAKAWLAMIERYANAKENDWTQFYIPRSNRYFHTPDAFPLFIGAFPYDNVTDSPSEARTSSRDRLCEWLKAKPGRKCVVVLVDQNSAWDYWRAARREVERVYSEPLKSKYLKESDKRLEGMLDHDMFSNQYASPPQTFAKDAKELMKVRSREANEIKLLLSELRDSFDDVALVDEVLKRREAALNTRLGDLDSVESPDGFPNSVEGFQEDESSGSNSEQIDDGDESEVVFDENEEISDEDIPHPTRTRAENRHMFNDEEFYRLGVDFGDFWESGVADGDPELWFRQYFVETSSFTEPPLVRFSGDPSWTSKLPEVSPLRERYKLVPCEGTETVLALGDFPLVCRRKVGDSEAILANTTSFLSNFGLTDPTNRKIAARLESEFTSKGDIGFLVSDTFFYASRVERRGYRHEKPEGRFTLTQATPFTILVWHAVVLAIIAGFCAWPIFGRARRVVRDETSDFGLHVDATARLLRNADSVSWVREQIDACRNFRKRDRPWGGFQSSESLDEQNSNASKRE